MKQAKYVFLGLIMMGLLSGCTGGKHVYAQNGACLTCINNPITGKPLNHNGSAPGSTVESRQAAAESDESWAEDLNEPRPRSNEEKITFSVPLDVDLAFVKIKREYGYFTEQEIRQEWGSLAYAASTILSGSYCLSKKSNSSPDCLTRIIVRLAAH